jgi:valyl-tRNA synthetase
MLDLVIYRIKKAPSELGIYYINRHILSIRVSLALNRRDILLTPMRETYDHLEVEPKIADLWKEKADFSPKVDPSKKPFSIILWPPNASGPMHVGNALMVALQDCLARYNRSRGRTTLWVPSIDHGGYETQVTFEKELNKNGKDKSDFSRQELFEAIKSFVDTNSTIIKNQIVSLGASVDWTRFRFTLDEEALRSTNRMFNKMVADKLIYRRPYMVHYCPSCGTLLSDIELKEEPKTSPLYFIKFPFSDGNGELTLQTARPEFLFATTHVLVHPNDSRFREHIGRQLINPSTKKTVDIVGSKRKFDPLKAEPLTPFNPSFDKYDYTYTLRNDIPSRNLLDWEGKMIEHYPGLTVEEARAKEVEKLSASGSIEKIDEAHVESIYLCKRGHTTDNLILETWFLNLDDKQVPLRQKALDTMRKEGLIVLPHWREKGIIEWLSKMPDWPIARQNVWGVKIPVWYDVSTDPSLFTIWFRDKEKKRQYGNLKFFLDQGISLEEISTGLERIYASKGAVWTLEKEAHKSYLPETDSFDTWFSSGDWSVMAYGPTDSSDFKSFYPSESLIIGYDLLRLSVCREIFLSAYVTGRLPFKIVYLHHLIKGKDGQKMSKSLGNATTLESYIEKYGADVTRMSLVSYTSENEDFVLEEKRIDFFKSLCDRLWKIGRIVNLANEYNVDTFYEGSLPSPHMEIMERIDTLTNEVGKNIEKYRFAYAQEALSNFLNTLEEYVSHLQDNQDINLKLSVLKYIFQKYIVTLHPFAPFITEELYTSLYDSHQLLASKVWPQGKTHLGR